ncbi:MAG: RHS repeat-associated core domain-containing protein, partial [Bacteroidota bacterium]
QTYITSSFFDALSRPIRKLTPDNSQTIYRYNEANLLDAIDLDFRGSGALQPIVRNIEYNAHGMRTKIRCQNGVTTTYEYDAKTFRLRRLKSTRSSDSKLLQDLNYYFDPVGNITDIFDDAQDNVYFDNAVIKPHGSYTYDLLYRLKKATGREQIANASPPTGNSPDHVFIPGVNTQSADALQVYSREYDYDKLGNILQVRHKAQNNSQGWTRYYQYESLSPLDSSPEQWSNKRNFLSQTSYTDAPGGPFAFYSYDAHGNMTSMPHLLSMNWDFMDQFKNVDLGGGGHEYYTYTLAGGKDFGVRRRKVTEKAGGKICDRIYIGDFELYRERMAGGVQLVRESLHVQDDNGRILLIDHQTLDSGQVSSNTNYRYQLSNHLGSATVELDELAQLISYEEHYSYGGSSFRSGRSTKEVKEKRYRYTGKERDNNTGLDYYGGRYYDSIVLKWISPDPKGYIDGFNLYLFSKGNPVSRLDKNGFNSEIVINKKNKEFFNSI